MHLKETKFETTPFEWIMRSGGLTALAYDPPMGTLSSIVSIITCLWWALRNIYLKTFVHLIYVIVQVGLLRQYFLAKAHLDRMPQNTFYLATAAVAVVELI